MRKQTTTHSRKPPMSHGQLAGDTRFFKDNEWAERTNLSNQRAAKRPTVVGVRSLDTPRNRPKIVELKPKKFVKNQDVTNLLRPAVSVTESVTKKLACALQIYIEEQLEASARLADTKGKSIVELMIDGRWGTFLVGLICVDLLFLCLLVLFTFTYQICVPLICAEVFWLISCCLSLFSFFRIQPYAQLPYFLCTGLIFVGSIWLITRAPEWQKVLLFLALIEQTFFFYVKVFCFKLLIRKRKLVAISEHPPPVPDDTTQILCSTLYFKMVSATKKPTSAKETTKPTASKAPKAAEKKPAEKKPTEKKVDPKPKAAEKAVEKPTAKPVEKPVENTSEKPTVKAKAAEKPKPKQKAKPKPKVVKKVANKKKRKQTVSFKIECKNPVEDGILKVATLEEFLKAKIKTKGKVGQLEQNGIRVAASKSAVTVTSDQELSKRYLKYLVKKFLKRNTLRDWLRVVATQKDTYELRYFQINQEDEGDAEE
ncbi:Ribosomal protein L22e family-containing protein [Aphelenchoides besseyi]|nr:Ribosomal protein L22e family-containing protein [Aphelenchoides besseyi]